MARTVTFGVVSILFIILFHSFETSAARKLARNLPDHSCTHVNVSGNGGEYRRSLAFIRIPFWRPKPRVKVKPRRPHTVPRPPPPAWRVPAHRSPPGQHS